MTRARAHGRSAPAARSRRTPRAAHRGRVPTGTHADDLFSNLHGKVGKTALPRVLANLVTANLVTQKTYGKQVVYVVRQVRGRHARAGCTRRGNR